ncbi:MAG: glycosyltransferase family 9 protein [Nitrososphaerales archaeon]
MSNPFEPGFLTRLPQAPRKVVVLRTNRIGDFLLATPALRALRAALPGAHFTFIGLFFLRDLVARSPHLDRFVEFPGFPGMAEQFFDARVALQFFAAMQEERFDLAIQLNGSGVYSNPFALMLGARWTAGWVRPQEGAGLLQAALPLPESGHEVDRVMSLPIFLGAPDQGRQTEFPLWQEDRDTATELLAAARVLYPRPAGRPAKAGATGSLIGVHPGAREMTKRWDPARFAAAAAEIQRRHGGTIVVVGGAEERELAAQTVAALPADCSVLDLAGRTTLPVLGALVERMSLLLTNDSGPAHIAYALGTPTVTVFGGTDPCRWGPRGGDEELPEHLAAAGRPGIALANPVHCWPCPHWVCPTNRECLAGISVEAVVDAAERVMSRERV